MENESSSQSNIFKILIILTVIIGACLVIGIFWWQSKEFGTKATGHIKNMQNTVQKASDLQKQINQQIKEQEKILKNLE